MTVSLDNRERGDTLVELLVAVIVMGIAVVAVTGGIAVSIRMSDIHRKQAAAGAYVRAFAEAIETRISASPTGYVPCAGPGTYDAAFPFSDPAFTRDTPAVDYWTGSSFGNTCVPAADSGVQRVSLRVASIDSRVSQSLVIIIRKPCRSAVDFPLDTACG